MPRRGFDEQVCALPAISSSLIRERLANRETISDVVPAAVADLIARSSWYLPNK